MMRRLRSYSRIQFHTCSKLKSYLRTTKALRRDLITLSLLLVNIYLQSSCVVNLNTNLNNLIKKAASQSNDPSLSQALNPSKVTAGKSIASATSTPMPRSERLPQVLLRCKKWFLNILDFASASNDTVITTTLPSQVPSGGSIASARILKNDGADMYLDKYYVEVRFFFV